MRSDTSRSKPARLVPSRLVPSRLVPSRLVPSRLVPSCLVPSRVAGVAVFALALAACGDDDATGAIPKDGGLDGGPACTVGLYDPTRRDVDAWPEPRMLVDDPGTATGKRLRVEADTWPELLATAGGYARVFTEDLSDLDGFGVNAEAFFRFGRAFDRTLLPTGAEASAPDAGLGFVVLDPAPRFVPALLRTTDRDATLMFAPQRPLPEATWVAAFVTRALTPAAGGCLEPSEGMAARLAAPSPEDARAIAALTSLGLIASARDLVSLVVYPTQSIVEESIAVAADVLTRDFALDGAPVCTPDTTGRWRQCEAAFVAGDYRDADAHVPARARGAAVTPQSTYRVPITVWLPPAGAGPFPTLLYGHGLGGGREQGARLAEFAAPLGIATVAIDAVRHGEHPTNAGARTDTLNTVLNFFTFDGDRATRAIDGRKLRDHFRQSTWDKLQLTRLLAAGIDVDGDGTDDVDGTRLAYLGVSLGGIMGSELAALTDAYGAVVLVVPGGRVSAIIADSETFRPLINLVRPRSTTAGDVDRFFPVLQTVLERGDAASYGPHLLRDRLAPAGMRVPSVLVGVVLDDDTVPNTANYALARAIGVDVVPPTLRAEIGLAATAPPPVIANVAPGTTAGLLQFDVVREGTAVRPATHSNVGDSEVGAAAWLRFLSSHWETGAAEIVDPYALTGLAHAAP